MYSMNDEEKMKMVIKMDPAKVQNFKLVRFPAVAHGSSAKTGEEMLMLVAAVHGTAIAGPYEADQCGNGQAVQHCRPVLPGQAAGVGLCRPTKRKL